MSCEACRLRAATEHVTDASTDLPAYRLCVECACRLEQRALRPLEWFNLAVIHGPTRFHLHDDFYDSDGHALQPKAEVHAPELFPAPTLQQSCSHVHSLVDYAITRWILEPETAAALSRYPASSILADLSRRLFDSVAPASDDTVSISLQILSRVVGPAGADVVRKAWETLFDKKWRLASLSRASAACLPPDEGFSKVTRALDSFTFSEKARFCEALDYFRSEQALDWIERALTSPDLPVDGSWGRLAATSRISWSRISRWLGLGRPLSLVALDALTSCYHYNTGLLRELKPKLQDPASLTAASTVLTAYSARDDAARTKQIVAAILAHWPQVCGPSSSA